jgi:two-component system sensor histidine kinase/response regulator
MSKKAMESGISAYLVKPIKQSLLFNTINNLLNKAIPIEKAPGRTSLENKSHQVSGKDLKQIRILLAEDNPANRKLAIIQMEKLGYSVDSVENGKKALEKISEEPGNYAVVFMDCQMPEMDGFEATRLIRKLEKNNGVHTPIIAMTANALEEDQKICKDAGMDDYISKPVTMKVLAEMLEHWSKPFRDKNQAGQDS